MVSKDVTAPERSRLQDLEVAVIAARIRRTCSKLATSRGLKKGMLVDTPGEELGVEDANDDGLYEAMDWLVDGQEAIEQRLAKKHLTSGSLVQYDLISSYFEGRCCPLAKRGYYRDRKCAKLQIVFGLLWTTRGVSWRWRYSRATPPSPSTVSRQVEKLR